MTSIDEFDRRIIQLMLLDCRQSNVAIGYKIGLSHSAVARRLNKLEEMGIFASFGSQINWSALGYSIRSDILISRNRNFDRDSVWDKILSVPNVLTLNVVTGAHDFKGSLVAIDLNNYSDVIDRLLKIEGVDKIESLMILREKKGHGASGLIGNASSLGCGATGREL